MAHITDYDVWHESEAPVTVDMVIKTLHKNTALAQEAVRRLVKSLKPERHCDCKHALSTALTLVGEGRTRELLKNYPDAKAWVRTVKD